MNYKERIETIERLQTLISNQRTGQMITFKVNQAIDALCDEIIREAAPQLQTVTMDPSVFMKGLNP